jgi:hypothetical protein
VEQKYEYKDIAIKNQEIELRNILLDQREIEPNINSKVVIQIKLILCGL